MIRPATPADAAAIASIYNHYVDHTVVTFEETPVSADEMAGRIQAVTAQWPWLVTTDAANRVLGYAYAGKWRERRSYRHTVESTVYLAHDAVGRGHGGPLYRELLRLLRQTDAHVIVAGIALPNTRSVALHERLGFEKVAHFKEVGRKFDRWIDVGDWQLTLAR